MSDVGAASAGIPGGSLAFLHDVPWRYTNSDGYVIARRLRLRPDGRIEGHDHPNERGWIFRDGALCLLDQDGVCTSRLTLRPGDTPGQIVFGGSFLPLRHRQVEHFLRTPDPARITYPLRLRWNAEHAAFFKARRVYLLSPFDDGCPWADGDDVVLERETRVEPYASLPGRFTTMGSFSYCLSPRLAGRVTIGRYCSIALGVDTMGEGHPLDRVSTSPVGYAPFFDDLARREFGTGFRGGAYDQHAGAPPEIGNDVWIGADVLLKRGIRIGDGAVIGARAVVTRDVPPYAIVAGVPARLVRFRFPPPVVERLLRARWWRFRFCDLPHDWTDVGRFLDELEAGGASGGIRPFEPDPIDVGLELLRLG